VAENQREYAITRSQGRDSKEPLFIPSISICSPVQKRLVSGSGRVGVRSISGGAGRLFAVVLSLSGVGV
jgi:hypothetical protein